MCIRDRFFSDKAWPSFTADDFDLAISAFQGRERRFGLTSQQVREQAHAAGPVLEGLDDRCQA